MSFLKNIFSKKWTRLTTALLGLLSFIIPNITHAQISELLGIGQISYSVISYAAFGVTWLIGSVAGFFVIIETYAIEQVLSMSFGIINSPVVKLGFPISLSVANLVFVGGLIVIAVATILRIQSYGLKNILWKVVSMAILVNFGLVIAGTILTFSDNLTLYFIDAISPAGENGSVVDFATNIASAFNPQKLIISGVENASPEDIKKFQADFNSTASTGTFLKPIIGITLSLWTFMIVLVILGALFLVLAYRYLVISLLLVGLPIMWAAWPFPSLSQHFSEWWHKFINQAFAPIPIVFFLWLGLMTAQQMNNVSLLIHPIANSKEGTGPEIFKFLGAQIAPVIDSFMQAILLGAILGAGLLISGKMGATFATSGTNAIKAVNSRFKKGLTSKAARGAKRAGQYVKANAASQGLQKAAVSLRRKTTGRIGEIANATSLRIQNIVLKTQDMNKQRVHMNASGTIYGKNGNPIIDANGVVAKAKWDHKKHDWERDPNGDIVNQNTGIGVNGGKAKIDSVTFTDHHNNRIKVRDASGAMVDQLDGAEAAKWGITDGNKPTAHVANLTLDANGNIKDVRAATELVAERLKEVEDDLTVQSDQYLTASQKKARKAIAALDVEAEHEGGILSDVAGALNDASKALAQPGGGGGGGGGHDKPAKKDDHGGHH